MCLPAGTEVSGRVTPCPPANNPAPDRRRHHPEGVEQHREVEPGEVEDLRHRRIGQDPREHRRRGRTGQDLDHVGAAVAAGDLDHAEAVAMRIEPHRFAIDGDNRPKIKAVGQIGLIHVIGHSAQYGRHSKGSMK